MMGKHLYDFENPPQYLTGEMMVSFLTLFSGCDFHPHLKMKIFQNQVLVVPQIPMQ